MVSNRPKDVSRKAHKGYSMFDDIINTPEMKAEEKLLDLTEEICKIHGQYKGIYYILYRLLEWSATRLIWR